MSLVKKDKTKRTVAKIDWPPGAPDQLVERRSLPSARVLWADATAPSTTTQRPTDRLNGYHGEIALCGELGAGER